MFKYLATASVIALSSAGAAFSQGFDGFYAGAELGWNTTSSDFCLACTGDGDDWADATERNLDFDGAVVGIFGGRNFALPNNKMWGIEGSLSYNSNSWEGSLEDLAAVTDGYEASAEWLASVTGRYGWIQGQNLLYVTGGLAATQLDLDNPDCPDCSAPGTTNFLDSTHLGAVVGVGIERTLTDRLNIRGQLLHYEFGTVDTEIPENGIEYADNEASLRSTTLSVGLSYNF
jgi:opacity protein-like surface antigen